MNALARTSSLRRARLATWTVVVLCGLAGAALASEPTKDASIEFEQGRQAAARGDYPAAAAAFLRAHHLAPHAVALYNAALALDASNSHAQAADALAEALEMGSLPKPQSSDAETRLQRLEGRLGLVVVHGPPGSAVSVAHADRIPTPARIHVERGDLVIRVWYTNGESETRKAAVAAQPLELWFDHAPLTRRSEPRPVQPTSPRDDLPSADSGRTIGWVAAGTGTALALTSAVLGLRAWSARDDFNASGKTDRAAHDSAESYRLWTNVSLAGAVAAGGVGVYLLTRPGDSPPPPAQQPTAMGRPLLRFHVGWGTVGATAIF